jgi:hypothetical protein
MTSTTPPLRAGTSRGRASRGLTGTNLTRPVTGGLALFVLVSTTALIVALLAGATFVFNVVVWLLFTVLWLVLLAAIALAPAAVDELWASLRRGPLVIQAILWLLFLPIAIGLWIWRRPWAPLIRLTLVVTLAAWNVFLFFPR